MSKDDRIVVRMSAELRAWVHEQARLGELDDAAFVRMVLSNARRGMSAPPMIAPVGMVEPSMVPAAVVARDVLEVATPFTQGYPTTGDAGGEVQADQLQTAAPSIDVDAMIGEALEDAEAHGLTEPAALEDAEPPPSGVRPLFRRPVPFSHATQNARLEQFFGGR